MQLEAIKDDKLSLDATIESAVATLKKKYPNISGRHLDIGSGTGNLIRRIQQEYPLESSALDYTDKFMALPHITVDVVDLNLGVLPYGDNQFDLVTFTEVAEHLENYRAIVREIHRTLKPGGVLILTTPNVLNMKSRLRFLITGFWSMFGPLHVGQTAIESAGGHITPIPWPFMAHALMEAGFTMPEVGTDKIQFPSLYWSVLLYLPIRLFAALAWRKERKKYKTVDQHNEPIVRRINAFPLLLGRSIVVNTTKA